MQGWEIGRLLSLSLEEISVENHRIDSRIAVLKKKRGNYDDFLGEYEKDLTPQDKEELEWLQEQRQALSFAESDRLEEAQEAKLREEQKRIREAQEAKLREEQKLKEAQKPSTTIDSDVW